MRLVEDLKLDEPTKPLDKDDLVHLTPGYAHLSHCSFLTRLGEMDPRASYSPVMASQRLQELVFR